MKTSNELLFPTAAEKYGVESTHVIRDDKPDWFQQIHNGVENVHVSVHPAKPRAVSNAHTTLPMWREIALFGLALVLICYSYYTTN